MTDHPRAPRMNTEPNGATAMTWLTTWPTTTSGTQYAAHDTEQEATAHAAEIVRSGQAPHATAFEVEDGEA